MTDFAHLQGPAKARYVSAMFGRISRRYDLLNTVMTGGLHHRWRNLTARTAAEGLHGRALDVATGTGDMAFALARRPEVTSVVGIDFSPQMLELVPGKAAKQRLTGRVALTLGDALKLPFADNSFVCATSGFALRNVIDVQRSLAEMTRVVQPGGRVVLLEITPVKRQTLFGCLFRFYFERVVPLCGQVLAGDRTAYTYLPDSVNRFLSAEELAALMAEVGLRQVSYRRLGFGSMALHWGTKG